ncbi:MAG: bifunctional hydroxymethylpyrimidine kinase/phosphomethylpyrimidine kinase [Nitrospirae bacterium]|nr:MAG: bifunctional hydroxymethylpyrimidine kinase/phosphomethylpyrimidine kinase [Nitrospirota bacterium]
MSISHKKLVLTIAGSDSGGGAGIQADIKSLSANGVFALSVVTAITAQNTIGVTKVYDLPADMVMAQLDAVLSDFELSAIKIGMLSNADIVQTVSEKILEARVSCVVVDPVMVAKSGHRLLQDDAVTILKQRLIPLATLVTPNVHEAEWLTGMTIRTLADARQAAKALHSLGCRFVLIKGGHLEERPATDLLYDGRFFRVYQGEWIQTPHTHGTGCTYASAIAAHLARGLPLPDAIDAAKTYTTQAIRHGLPIGHGQGPLDHFYFFPISQVS